MIQRTIIAAIGVVMAVGGMIRAARGEESLAGLVAVWVGLCVLYLVLDRDEGGVR